ncbi:hypothetical protein [Stomatohabitans albus]|uniref:hypothetical protein n=1 Tax=Stomatohabitans albus TaxID=3110766 RepID=UPI00300CEF65
MSFKENLITSKGQMVKHASVPDTYDPHHPESGATTAEYGMLAGGVVVGGGLIYSILTSPFFEELVRKLFDFLAELIINTIQGAVAATAAGIWMF